MTTQSIIVYRNPAEAALWESGAVFPIMCAMVASIIAVLAVNWVYEQLPRNKRYGHGPVVAIAGIGTAIAVIFSMLIA
jgi:hypothetical protein